MRALALPVGARSIFALHRPPPGATRGAIVAVPAFAEEMNKSRRMVALQARALAAAGWHVLQFDLRGTGDSEGDFGDARWSDWGDDLRAARAWLRAESGHEPWLWGLRFGALLAAEALHDAPAPGLLLWQPVTSGKQHLQQFLRLKAGADWLAGERAAGPGPMDQLERGAAVEVAGYLVSPALALPPALPRLVWLELSPRAGDTLGPASRRVLAGADPATRVDAALVQGPSFWQSLEIEEAPALVDATLGAMAA